MQELIHGPPIATTKLCMAGIAKYPTTSGQHIIILLSANLFELSEEDLRFLFSFIKDYTYSVKAFLNVRRCGFAYDGYTNIHIIPMHGLSEQWAPVMAEEVATSNSYKGYLWTKSSPHIAQDALDEVQCALTTASSWQQPDYTFHGDSSDTNLFARLIRGEIPQWRIWENSNHLAFLTPFANTSGSTVLIPRRHLPSDILSLDEQDFLQLVYASQQVAKILMSGMKTGRVGLFFEGYEIDYAHVKLIPVLTDQAGIEGSSGEYHTTYPGYLTTQLGPPHDPKVLDSLHIDFERYYSLQTAAESTKRR